MHQIADTLLIPGILTHYVRGEPFPEVHQWADSFQPLMQSKHRMYLHDYAAVLKIYDDSENIDYAWSLFYHIILDVLSIEYGKEYCLGMLMEKIINGEIPYYQENMFPPNLTEYF